MVILWYANIMKDDLRKRATQLRDAGFSFNMIAGKIPVAKSTLSSWFKDRPFTPNKNVLRRIQLGPIKSAAKSHNKRVSEINRIHIAAIKEIGKLTKRDLWLLGIGLYLGEGSKTYEIVRITNADPQVIKLAMHWFRDILRLDDKNITIALHLYPDTNVKKAIKFWQKTTGLSKMNFRKTQIDQRIKRSKIKSNKLPHGTAHVTIVSNGNPEYGVRLHRRILGWIQGALSQS